VLPIFKAAEDNVRPCTLWTVTPKDTLIDDSVLCIVCLLLGKKIVTVIGSIVIAVCSFSSKMAPTLESSRGFFIFAGSCCGSLLFLHRMSVITPWAQ
jgi:hypothetical protein